MPLIAPSTSGFFNRSIAQLGDLRATIASLQGQIATGQRLERSSQDPLAASQLRQLERARDLATIDRDNAAAVRSDLELVAEALDGSSALLIRARELALSAANDTLSAEQRAMIASELEEISKAVLTNANSVSIGGEPLFAGIAAGPAYQRDASGAVVYVGAPVSAQVRIGEGITIERSITGPQAFSFTDANGPNDVFAHLATLAAALRGAVADPGAAARDAIGGFDAAIDTLGRAQAVIGARLNWIDNIEQMHDARSQTRAAREQEIGGTELTETIARLQQTLTVLEASQASFARVSSLSLFDRI